MIKVDWKILSINLTSIFSPGILPAICSKDAAEKKLSQLWCNLSSCCTAASSPESMQLYFKSVAPGEEGNSKANDLTTLQPRSQGGTSQVPLVAAVAVCHNVHHSELPLPLWRCIATGFFFLPFPLPPTDSGRKLSYCVWVKLVETSGETKPGKLKGRCSMEVTLSGKVERSFYPLLEAKKNFRE